VLLADIAIIMAQDMDVIVNLDYFF